MFFDKFNIDFKKIWTRQTLSIVSIFLLIIFGPALIAVDLTYLNDWVRSFAMGDLYTYLTFIGIISVWSIYGLIVVIMKSMTGINIYTYGLCFLVIVQFLIGFIHIILLYNTYRPILMNNCIQRQPSRFFWWSENYAENERFKETFDHCYSQWTQFSTERLVSWVVYSVASGLILTVVILHKLRISNEYKEARGYIVSNQEGEWLPTEKPTNDSTIPPPPYGDEINKEMAAMHQQRQKLYEEIDKRKRARKSLNRRSTISNADVIHPLDLSKKDAYQPPPMPSKDRRESWNRYEGHSQEDPVRNRLNSLTSERLDYELYKSNEPEVRRRHSSFGERKRRMSTRRRSRLGDSQRKQSARWSDAYNDKMPLIASANDVEEENDEEKEENERLMKSD